MDRSVDSIGSCSLDVDAESTDVSDTSGSLNFPTPISIKDITREFTNNIRERCSLQKSTKNITPFVDPIIGQSEVCITVTQPTATKALSETIADEVITKQNSQSPQTPELYNEKKPSYLNLACCVSGYSNITTYDSKVRQDINKSREVSPIRPSSHSLQYCKKGNSLTPPVLLTMPNINSPKAATTAAAHTTNTSMVTNGGVQSNQSITFENGVANETDRDTKLSFIEQRVVSLYGRSALEHGLYSPRKSKFLGTQENTHSCATQGSQHPSSPPTSYPLQPPGWNKHSNSHSKRMSTAIDNDNDKYNKIGQAIHKIPNDIKQVGSGKDDVDCAAALPCLKHLSPEFRAQLPIIALKKQYSVRTKSKEQKETENPVQVQSEECPVNGDCVSTSSNVNSSSKCENVENDKMVQQVLGTSTINDPIKDSLVTYAEENDVNEKLSDANVAEQFEVYQETEKDGHYFLKQVKSEQKRLLHLAEDAESYLAMLTDEGINNEDTLGLLRSASGKARLLVSQKMKQFEGLCHKNLDNKLDDKYPTTIDDLQGFWDMVYLQVENIDSIFKEIDELKANNWVKLNQSELLSQNYLNKKFEERKTYGRAKKMVTHGKRSSPNLTNSTHSATTLSAEPSSSSTTTTTTVNKREMHRKQIQELKRRNREMLVAAASKTDSLTTSTDGNDEKVKLNG